MLKVFKQGIVLQLVVILVTIVALWASAFVVPVSMPEPTTFAPLYAPIHGLMSGMPIVCTLMALALVIGEGLMLNELLYSRGLVSQNTLLPMFLYVLLMSYGHASHTLTPALFVNLLTLLGMTQMLQAGQPNITVSKLANTALCVSLASMIYFPAIAMMLPLVLLMPTFKMYRWNDWSAMLLGLIGPYLVAALVCFMNGTLASQAASIASTFVDFKLHYAGTTAEYVTNGIMGMLVLAMTVGGLSRTSNRTSVYKNNVRVAGLPIIAGLAIMLFGPIFPLQMGWLAVSLSFAMALLLGDNKKKAWIYELMLLALVALTAITAI